MLVSKSLYIYMHTCYLRLASHTRPCSSAWRVDKPFNLSEWTIKDETSIPVTQWAPALRCFICMHWCSPMGMRIVHGKTPPVSHSVVEAWKREGQTSTINFLSLASSYYVMVRVCLTRWSLVSSCCESCFYKIHIRHSKPLTPCNSQYCAVPDFGTWTTWCKVWVLVDQILLTIGS